MISSKLTVIKGYFANWQKQQNLLITVLVLKTSSPDSVVRQRSIIADIVKPLQTDKVQLINTLILHAVLGYTTYRWDCKPNSLNLLHSGTQHWVKQGENQSEVQAQNTLGCFIGQQPNKTQQETQGVKLKIL